MAIFNFPIKITPHARAGSGRRNPGLGAQAADLAAGTRARSLSLKGIEHPVTAHVLGKVN